MANEPPVTPSLPVPQGGSRRSTRRVRGKALALLLGVFTLGLGSGTALDRAGITRQGFLRPAAPLFSMRRDRHMQDFMQQFDLTEEQRQRVSATIDRSVERVRSIRQKVRPQYFDVMEEMRREIEGELTPEQREQFRRQTATFMRRRMRWMRRHHRGMGMGMGRGMNMGRGMGPGRMSEPLAPGK